MTLTQAIAAVFKDRMDKLGMKKKDFAAKSGMTTGYITRLMKGDIQNIGLETMMKLVRPFGMTIDELLYEVEKKKTSEGVSLSLSRKEFEEMLRLMPNNEEKKTWLRRLRDRLPEIPEWLKTENHIKYVQSLPPDPLIPGIATDEQQQQNSCEQPQEC